MKCFPILSVAIQLDQKGRFDHLNLLMIPNTVIRILLRRTKLKTISEWTDLKGKSLKVLRLDRNSDLLELNLDGLKGDSNHLPLEHLSVCVESMKNYFAETDWQRILPKIGEWMRKSTLNSLRLWKRTNRNFGRDAYFDSDGSWTLKERINN